MSTSSVARLPTPRKATTVEMVMNTKKSLEEEVNEFFEAFRPTMLALARLDQEVIEKGWKDLEVVAAWAEKQEEHINNNIEANKMEVFQHKSLQLHRCHHHW